MKLLFVSGWAHDGSAFKLVSEMFSDEDVEVTSVHDLIIESELEFTIDNYSLALEHKIKSYNEKPIVIGWSMGAMVLTELLAEKQNLISKGILISGTAKFCKSDNYNLGIDKRNVKALKLGLRKSIDDTLKLFFNDCSKPMIINPDLLASKINIAKNQGLESLSCGLDYLLKKDLREIKTNHDSPVLIIHGELDEIIPFSAGEYLRRNRFDDSELFCILQGNHDIISSNSKTVYKHIRKFIYNE